MTVDADRVRARLLTIRALLDHLAGLGDVDEAALTRDFGLRLQVERVLSQVITLATEINSHVVASELGRAPADLRRSFDDMATAGWLPCELVAEIRDSTGLRNVLIHEYVELDLRILAAAVPETLRGYRAYVREVVARLG